MEDLTTKITDTRAGVTDVKQFIDGMRTARDTKMAELNALKNQLKEHERSHTGEKPEMCKWCGMKFSNKSTLVNHERLHTGEKPFKCNFCDKAFAQRNSLKVHKKSNHPES